MRLGRVDGRGADAIEGGTVFLTMVVVCVLAIEALGGDGMGWDWV